MEEFRLVPLRGVNVDFAAKKPSNEEVDEIKWYLCFPPNLES